MFLGPEVDPFAAQADRAVAQLDVLQIRRSAGFIDCIHSDPQISSRLSGGDPGAIR